MEGSGPTSPKVNGPAPLGLTGCPLKKLHAHQLQMNILEHSGRTVACCRHEVGLPRNHTLLRCRPGNILKLLPCHAMPRQ